MLITALEIVARQVVVSSLVIVKSLFIVEILVNVESLVIVESLGGGGETGDDVGEAGGCGEAISRSTLKSKMSRLDCCLERINCED